MAPNLAELAELVGGQLVGPGGTVIQGAATLGDARPGDITFIDSADKAHKLSGAAASAAVVPLGVVPGTLPAIQVDDVPGAFTRIVCRFRPPRRRTRVGVHRQAAISPRARIGEDVDIYPGVTIGDDVEIGAGSTIHAGVHIMAGSKLGRDVTIYPNAVLYEDTIVGDRSVIHGGAVLGAFGFGYKLVGGRHQLSAQLGYVELGPDVEIGAGTTIDRGTYGPTIIGEGTKIDNQVMIAHNCRLGRHNLICSQVGIAGSTTTGDFVVMAGQAGVRDHVHIGRGAVLGAKSGVMNDVPEASTMFGAPALPEREWKIKQALFNKLPELRQQLKQLQAAVAQLQRERDPGGQAAA